MTTERTCLPPTMLDDWRVLPAVLQIEKSVEAEITLAALASAAGLSPFHFHRRFLATIGETPGSYTRRTRLDHAAIQVARSKAGLIEIGLQHGYESAPGFSRAFLRRFGMPPMRFRSLSGQLPSLPRIHHERAALVRPTRLVGAPVIGGRFYGTYADVPSFWTRFARVLAGFGFPLDRAQPVGVLFDDPTITQPGRVRYDCCVLDLGYPGHLVRNPLFRGRIRAGWFASLRHLAPYDTAAEAVLSVVAVWLPGERRQIGLPPAYEVYYAPPWAGAGSTDLSLMIPIA